MMQYIDVYDTTLQKIARIYTWNSIIWNNCYDTAGKIEIDMYPDADLMQSLVIGNYIVWSESDNAAVIESVDVEFDKLCIYGHDALILLDHRSCTESYGNGNAEVLMCQIVNYCCAGLGISTVTYGLTDKYKNRTSDKSVLEMLETISEATGVGFRMRIVNSYWVFSCFKPAENTNSVYAMKYGNLTDANYSRSIAKYKNVAVVAGCSVGGERVTVTVGETSSTGLNRRELYVDARDLQQDDDETDVEYNYRLADRGWDKLLECPAIESLECDVSTADIELGQTVRVLMPEFGVDEFTARITGILIINENGITTKTATIGNTIKHVVRS